VDPDEHAGEMRGLPFARVTSPDGRWAYTLYDGGGEQPFVHALDTAAGKAVCVDLDGLVTVEDVRRGDGLSISPDGSEVTVAGRRGAPLAVIDTETLEANAPPSPDGGDGGFPWLLAGLAGALGLAAGGAVFASRHLRASRLATPDA
jgi:hypothetical protein